jgi:hypothetical protein
MVESSYFVVKPKRQDDWQKLTEAQRRMLDDSRYTSAVEAAKARLKLQLSLRVELQISSVIDSIAA